MAAKDKLSVPDLFRQWLLDNPAVATGSGGAGGLTNTELRATPVPVTNGLVQALTNTELRASRVPVATDGLTRAQLDSAAVATISNNITASGLVTAINDAVTISAVGMGAFSAVVTGTWTGTISIEATTDGADWSPLSAVVQGGTGTLVTAITTNNHVRGTISGLAQMRMRLTTVGTGTATIVIVAGYGTSGVFMVAPVPIASPVRAQTARFSAGLVPLQLDTTPLSKRRAVAVKYNSGGATASAFVYVGFTNALTTSNGLEVVAGETARFDVTDLVQIWVVSNIAGQAVQMTELGE